LLSKELQVDGVFLPRFRRGGKLCSKWIRHRVYPILKKRRRQATGMRWNGADRRQVPGGGGLKGRGKKGSKIDRSSRCWKTEIAFWEFSPKREEKGSLIIRVDRNEAPMSWEGAQGDLHWGEKGGGGCLNVPFEWVNLILGVPTDPEKGALSAENGVLGRFRNSNGT